MGISSHSLGINQPQLYFLEYLNGKIYFIDLDIHISHVLYRKTTSQKKNIKFNVSIPKTRPNFRGNIKKWTHDKTVMEN